MGDRQRHRSTGQAAGDVATAVGARTEGPQQARLTQLATSLKVAPAVTRLQAIAGTLQRKPNRSGLPDQLKSGIETLSGQSLDHVKVHYNSTRPAQLNALAFAQGSDIHVAPGQERHLPHEGWHLVQQMQAGSGRRRRPMAWRSTTMSVLNTKQM